MLARAPAHRARPDARSAPAHGAHGRDHAPMHLEGKDLIAKAGVEQGKMAHVPAVEEGSDPLDPLAGPVRDEPNRWRDGEPADPDATAQPDPDEGDEQPQDEDAGSGDDEGALLAAWEEGITLAGDPPIALGVVRAILSELAEAMPSPLVVERALGLLRKASGIRIETLRHEYAATMLQDGPAAEPDGPEETAEERAARRAELWPRCRHRASQSDILAAVRRVVQEQL